MLLEDAEHPVLHHHLAQLTGVFAGGQPQQQPVIELLQSEEVELAGVGQHGAIIVVLVAVEIVVGGIEGSLTLQQLHFRHRATFCEHADGLLSGGLVAMDGQRSIDDLLHAMPQQSCVLERHGTIELQVDVIAVADRHVD